MSDYAFMKTGFNTVIEKENPNEIIENAAAIAIVYMENAIKSAAIYSKHAKRKEITVEDIRRGLMLEMFFIKKRPDTLKKCEDTKQKIKNILEEEEKSFDDTDYDEDEEDTEQFTESKCKCAMCLCLNTIYERWNKWKPETSLEQIIHKAIEEIS